MRIKVGPRDESYVWVPETLGFVLFQKIGFSPILVLLNLRVVNGRVVQPQPYGTEFSDVGTVFRDNFRADFED